MKIIGHRGAAGLAPENTIASIKAAAKSGADMIEIDVRLTADKKIVLQHDDNLMRTENINLKISSHTLKQLRTPHPKLPTLEDALKANKTSGAIIEIKDYIQPYLLLQTTDKFSGQDIRFASFNPRVIRDLKKYSPASYCYLLEHYSPFEIVNHAKKIKADGIGVNFAILNPLTYYLAKKHNLSIYVYTIDNFLLAKIYYNPLVIKMYLFFYKDISVCTDYPNHSKKKD